LTSLKLLKVALQSYIEKMKILNTWKNIYMPQDDNHLLSSFHKWRTYYNSLRKLNLHSQRRGAWRKARYD